MKGRKIMEQPKVGEEMRKMPVEPLLPVEKKLIGWSLGIGLVLLVIHRMISSLNQRSTGPVGASCITRNVTTRTASRCAGNTMRSLIAVRREHILPSSKLW